MLGSQPYKKLIAIKYYHYYYKARKGVSKEAHNKQKHSFTARRQFFIVGQGSLLPGFLAFWGCKPSIVEAI
jgi:hypothetical protein